MRETKRAKNSGIIMVVTLALIVIALIYEIVFFGFDHIEDREQGSAQLLVIKGQFENILSEEKELSMTLAAKVREYGEDEERVRDFIYKKKDELVNSETGLFNVYAANEEFAVIPDFDMPDDYNVTERKWYIEAIKNGGNAVVTSPYRDAMTGDKCYTVSALTGDGKTVVGVDYNTEKIQNIIKSLQGKNYIDVVVVADEGIIAGCDDENLVGTSLIRELPDYSGIWSLVKEKNEIVTTKIRLGFLYRNIYAVQMDNGLYLIAGIGDWELFSRSYVHLILILFILACSLILFIRFVIAFQKLRKNKKNQKINEQGDRSEYEYDVAKEEKKEGKKKKKAIGKRFQRNLTILMIIIAVASELAVIRVTLSWGIETLNNEKMKYEQRLGEWIATQKGMLDLFATTFSTNPDMVNDYDGTVKFLDRIENEYDNISSTYIANPKLDPVVYVNTGWTPDADWKVEERDWYVELENSGRDWIISSPYYDVLTNKYCVTFAKKVYDFQTGEFIGNFGMDITMDDLVDILGDSYTVEGYAFLVDPKGYIINHPYGDYQMTSDKSVNVADTIYAAIVPDKTNAHTVRDYDGTFNVVTAERDELSNFSIYVSYDMPKIYGAIFLYGSIELASFIALIIVLYKLTGRVIKLNDITNEKLKEEAENARNLSNAKDKFLALMSHEIRTPINTILGMNEMILRESKDENVLDYAESSHSAGRMLLYLINSILDFSKIEAGKMELAPVKYKTAVMIHNLTELVIQSMQEKGLDIVVDVDESIPSELIGDDLKVSQIIMNLLSNAIKYTQEGKVTLSVRKLKTQGECVILEVKVSDTGIGIKKEDMGKLLNSFERLDEEKNRYIQGTGLGLNIVAKLLEMMGSTLHVESKYGVGSVFSFELKQEIADKEPIGDYNARIKESVRENEGICKFSSGSKVLVVDDNRMNLKVARNIFRLFNISIDVASSGLESLEKIRDKKYDIVFMDHIMPDMDGIKTLRKIKEEKLIPESTAVIALTANALSGDRERYVSAGFDDYLSKPIELKNLQDILIKYLPENLRCADMPVTDNGKPAKEQSNASDESIKRRIKATGLDFDAAMEYFGDVWEYYEETLTEVVDTCDDDIHKLDDFLKTGDMKGYEALIHSLKSTLRLIGEVKLADSAAALEKASHSEDIDYVKENNDDFTSRYRLLTADISKVLRG